MWKGKRLAVRYNNVPSSLENELDGEALNHLGLPFTTPYIEVRKSE